MKVMCVLDAANLYYSARDLYGASARVDYKKILKLAQFTPTPERLCFLVYINPYQMQYAPFLKMFTRLGYEVRENIEYLTDISETAPFSDVTDQLQIDVFRALEDYDVFIVASGRGRYVPLYKKIKMAGKQLHVASFGHSCNSYIPPLVNKLILLDDKYLFDLSALRAGHEDIVPPVVAHTGVKSTTEGK